MAQWVHRDHLGGTRGLMYKKKTELDIHPVWEQYWETESEESKKELMEYYIPLVEKIAASMYKKLPNSTEFGDLVNDGFFGLVNAIERFDPSRGFKFETYASNRIRGEISDKLRDHDWVSRYFRLKFKLLHQTRDVLLEELQRFPSEQEVADRVGWSLDEVHKIQSAFSASYPENLSERMSDSGHEIFPIQDLLEDKSIGDPDFNVTLSDISDRMLKALMKLKEKESKVVYLYHYEGLSFNEIGSVLEVNSSRVSQIYGLAISELKESLVG